MIYSGPFVILIRWENNLWCAGSKDFQFEPKLILWWWETSIHWGLLVNFSQVGGNLFINIEFNSVYKILSVDQWWSDQGQWCFLIKWEDKLWCTKGRFPIFWAITDRHGDQVFCYLTTMRMLWVRIVEHHYALFQSLDSLVQNRPQINPS